MSTRIPHIPKIPERLKDRIDTVLRRQLAPGFPVGMKLTPFDLTSAQTEIVADHYRTGELDVRVVNDMLIFEVVTKKEVEIIASVNNNVIFRKKFELGVRRISIGRCFSVDCWINDESVDRSHAVITFRKDGGMTIDDLASRSGTFVDGERVSGKAFGFDSKIRVGQVSLTVSPVDGPARAAPSQPAPDPWAAATEVLKTVYREVVGSDLLHESGGKAEDVFRQTVLKMVERLRQAPKTYVIYDHHDSTYAASTGWTRDLRKALVFPSMEAASAELVAVRRYSVSEPVIRLLDEHPHCFYLYDRSDNTFFTGHGWSSELDDALVCEGFEDAHWHARQYAGSAIIAAPKAYVVSDGKFTRVYDTRSEAEAAAAHLPNAEIRLTFKK